MYVTNFAPSQVFLLVVSLEVLRDQMAIMLFVHEPNNIIFVKISLNIKSRQNDIKRLLGIHQEQRENL